MAQVTRTQLISDTRQFMDAVGTDRWGDPLILSVLDSVFDGEWSNILKASPYYRVGTRSVTTDANGRFDLSALASGSGNSAERLYRIMTVTDGTYLYGETRFQDVPLGTSLGISSYNFNDKLFYLFGQQVQILPPVPNLALTITVNYKPPVPSALADDGDTVDFPDDAHLILVWEAAGRLLGKAGSEAASAQVLFDLAKSDRETLLSDLQRRTTQPLYLSPVDDARDWGGR